MFHRELLPKLDAGDELHKEAAAEIRRLLAEHRKEIAEAQKEISQTAREAYAEGEWNALERDRY